MLLQSRAATAPPPPAGGYFSTLPVGSALPTETECVARVNRSAWEPRLENNDANQTVPASVSLPGFTPQDGGVDIRSRAYADRVSGNFKGTTDEIIQWASCKWGFNDEITRAVAVTESNWKQSALGDYTSDQSRCQVGYTAACPESFGLTQVKATKHPGTFPSSRDSTAFNVDYVLMLRRICYEGWVNWLYSLPSGSSSYQAGDEWGCVGLHYSGRWYDSAADNYIKTVQSYYSSKPWLDWFDSSILLDVAGNLAEGKVPTTSASWSENLARVTDGDLTGNQYANLAGGPQWIKIDLGQSNEVGRLRLWHYYLDQRVYRDIIVQLSNSADFSSGVTTIFNNDRDNSAGQGVGSDTEYAETYNGKEITLGNITNARYVRLWSNGSNVNSANHYVEVRVYGSSGAPSTPPPSPVPPTLPEGTEDIIAPTVTITSPADGAQLGRGVIVAASASDNLDISKMELYLDGALESTAYTGSISYRWKAKSVKAGPHTITVKAYDTAGNNGLSSVTVYK